jgi:D-alanyl-lipoteichoic acid acyltransferase DltB (MBOAT superfamily)
MLFNSYSFIFVFLPVAFLGFFLLGKFCNQLAIPWLALSSLVFYAYWDWHSLTILLGSIFVNFTLASGISKTKGPQKKWLLVTTIFINILLLACYKYSNFFLSNINYFSEGKNLFLHAVVLPLGISFFTFTQIAYLVDVYAGLVSEKSFSKYLLFVSYFPHLIAGPVIHHSQVMSQFRSAKVFHLNPENIAKGISIFSIGLAKKTIIADTLSLYASPLFHSASSGVSVNFIEAWTGVLSYTLQLYFDFSGYCDMAIGLSLLFNIDLPINFLSPYKSLSIIDFWRRWHITLSKFLRDYLYIPLGGSKKGQVRRYLNLIITMLLGGFWHGAGWTFILWGGMHGLFLTINHLWRSFVISLGINKFEGLLLYKILCWLLTFGCVLLGWVMFRSDSLAAALLIYKSLIASGMNITLPVELQVVLAHLLPKSVLFANTLGGLQIPLLQAWSVILLGLFVVLFMPNTNEYVSRFLSSYGGVLNSSEPLSFNFFSSRLPLISPIFFGILFGISLLSMTRISEFLYFKF